MLKAILTSEDFGKLSDPLKAEYKKQEDGTYLLDVESVSGFALENIQGLKTVIQDRKNDLAAAKERLKAFEGLEPEAARAAIKYKAELEGISADEKVKKQIDGLKAQLQAKHEEEIRRVNDQLTGYKKSVTDLLVGREVMEALAKHEGKPKLLEHVVRGRSEVVYDEKGVPSIVVVDPVKRLPMVSMRPGNTGNMTVEELVESMKKDPDYQPAFGGSGRSGGGSGGSNGSGGSSGQGNNSDLSKMDPETRLAQIRARGTGSQNKSDGSGDRNMPIRQA